MKVVTQSDHNEFNRYVAPVIIRLKEEGYDIDHLPLSFDERVELSPDKEIIVADERVKHFSIAERHRHHILSLQHTLHNAFWKWASRSIQEWAQEEGWRGVLHIAKENGVESPTTLVVVKAFLDRVSGDHCEEKAAKRISSFLKEVFPKAEMEMQRVFPFDPPPGVAVVGVAESAPHLLQNGDIYTGRYFILSPLHHLLITLAKQDLLTHEEVVQDELTELLRCELMNKI